MTAQGSSGSSTGITADPPDVADPEPSRPPTAPYSPFDFRLRLDVDRAADDRPPSAGVLLATPQQPAVAPAAPPLLRPLVWDRLAGDVEVAPQVPRPEPVPTRSTLAAVPDAPPVHDVELPEIVVHDPDPTPFEPTPVVGLPAVHVAVEAPVPVDSAAPAATPVPQLAAQPIPVLSTVVVPAPVSTAAPRRPLAFEPVRPVAAPTRAARRPVLPRLFGMLLIVAIAAGGTLAVTRYLLEVPSWDAAVRPIAESVSTQRGLEFRSSVALEELPVEAYAAALAATVVPTDPASRARLVGEWRALGLLDGELDTNAVGRLAAIDMPAFYDSTRGVVVVAAGLGETLRGFAVERALTAALLDQHTSWSARLVGASPSTALGIRAVVDADALAVARAAIGTPAEHQRLAADLEQWSVAARGDRDADLEGDVAEGMEWLAAEIGRPGAVLAPVLANSTAEERTALVQSGGAHDGAVFDVARGTDATQSSLVTDPATTRGMVHWYDVLASRLSPAHAWSAATAWVGDTTAITVEGDRVCVTSLVAAADADGGSRLQQAFTEWASLAPAAAEATAAAVGETQVNVRACDPGATEPAPVTPAPVDGATAPAVEPSVAGVAVAGVPFGGASVEAAVVARAMLVQTGLAAPTRECLVTRLRSTLFVLSPLDSAPVALPAAGWEPPALAGFDVAAELVACRGG